MPIADIRRLREITEQQRKEGIGLSVADGDTFRMPAIRRADDRFYFISYKIIDGKIASAEVMVQSKLTSRATPVKDDADDIARELINFHYQPGIDSAKAIRETVDMARRDPTLFEGIASSVTSAFARLTGEEPEAEKPLLATASKSSTLRALSAFARICQTIDPNNQRGLIEQPESLFVRQPYVKLPTVRINGLELRPRLMSKDGRHNSFSISLAGGGREIKLFDDSGEVLSAFSEADKDLVGTFENPQKFLQSFTAAYLEKTNQVLQSQLPPALVKEAVATRTSTTTTKATTAAEAATTTAQTNRELQSLFRPIFEPQVRNGVDLSSRVGTGNGRALPEIIGKDGRLYRVEYNLEGTRVTNPKVLVRSNLASESTELKGEELESAVTELGEAYSTQVTRISGAKAKIAKAETSRVGTLETLTSFKEIARELDPANQRGLIEEPTNRFSRFSMSYDKLPVVTVGTINIRPRLKYERDGSQKTFSLSIEGRGEAGAITIFDESGNILPNFTAKDRALIPTGIATPQQFLEQFQAAYKAKAQEITKGNLPALEETRATAIAASELGAEETATATKTTKVTHPALLAAKKESQLDEARRQLAEERLLVSFDGHPDQLQARILTNVEHVAEDEADLETLDMTGLVPDVGEITDLQSYKIAFDDHLKKLQELEEAVKKELAATDVMPDDDANERISALVEEIQEGEERLNAARQQYRERYSRSGASVLTTSSLASAVDQSAASAKVFKDRLFESIGKPSVPGWPGRLSEYLRERPNVFTPYVSHDDPSPLAAAKAVKDFFQTRGNEAEKAELLSVLTEALRRSEEIARAEAEAKAKPAATATSGEEVTKLDFASFVGTDKTPAEERDSMDKVHATVAAALEKNLSPRLRGNKEAIRDVAAMLCDLTPQFYAPTADSATKPEQYQASSVIGMIDMFAAESRRQTMIASRLRSEEVAKRERRIEGLGRLVHAAAAASHARDIRSEPIDLEKAREEYFKGLRERVEDKFLPLTTASATRYGEVLPAEKRAVMANSLFFEKIFSKLNLAEKSQTVELVAEYARQLQDLTEAVTQHRRIVAEGKGQPGSALPTPLAEMPQEELNATRKAFEAFREDKAFKPIIAQLEAYEDRLRKSYDQARRFDMVARTTTDGYRAREAALITRITDSVPDNNGASLFGSFSLRTGKIFAGMASGVGAVDARLGTPLLSSAFANAAGFFFKQAEETGKTVGNREMVRDALTSSFAAESANIRRINRSPFARLRSFLMPTPPVVEVKRDIAISPQEAKELVVARVQERQASLDKEVTAISEEMTLSREAVFDRVTEMLETAQKSGIKLDQIAPRSTNRTTVGYRNFSEETNPSFFLRIKEEEGRITDVKLFRKTGGKSKEVELFDSSGKVKAEHRELFETILREYEADITAKATSAAADAVEARAIAAIADTAAIASETRLVAASSVAKFVEETSNLRIAHESSAEGHVTLKPLQIGANQYSLKFDETDPRKFEFFRNGDKVDIINQADLVALSVYLNGTRASIAVLETKEETQSALFTKTNQLITDARRFGVEAEILKTSGRAGFENYKNFAKDVADSPYFLRLHFDDKGNVDEVKLFEKGKTVFGFTTRATEIPAFDASGKLTPACEEAFATAERLLAPVKAKAETRARDAAAMVGTFITENGKDLTELSIDRGVRSPSEGRDRSLGVFEIGDKEYFLRFEKDNPQNFELRRKESGSRKGEVVDMTSEANVAILRSYLEQVSQEILAVKLYEAEAHVAETEIAVARAQEVEREKAAEAERLAAETERLAAEAARTTIAEPEPTAHQEPSAAARVATATETAATEVVGDITAEVGSLRTKLSRFSSASAERDERRDSVATAVSAESQDIDEVVTLTDRKSLLAALQAQADELAKIAGAKVEPAEKGGQKITLPGIDLAKKGATSTHPSYFVVITDAAGNVSDVKLHGGDPVSSILWKPGKDHERDLFAGDKIKDKHSETVPAIVEAYGKMVAAQREAEEEAQKTTSSFLGFSVPSDSARRDSFADLDDLPPLGISRRNPFLVEKKTPAAEPEVEHDADSREEVPHPSVRATETVHLSDAKTIARADADEPAVASVRRKRSKFAAAITDGERGGSGGITAGGR